MKSQKRMKKQKFIEEIKEREKGVDKAGFSRYFKQQPSTLVSNLLSQNTNGLKKSSEKIKDWIKDDRNSTNEKSKNDILYMILSFVDRIYQFFEYKFLPSK